MLFATKPVRGILDEWLRGIKEILISNAWFATLLFTGGPSKFRTIKEEYSVVWSVMESFVGKKILASFVEN